MLVWEEKWMLSFELLGHFVNDRMRKKGWTEDCLMKLNFGNIEVIGNSESGMTIDMEMIVRAE